VTASATYKITDMLRDLGCATGAAARQLSRPRVVATVVGITVLIAAATWIPLPAPVRMRDWAELVGPWFPLAFLVAQVVVTIAPVPRTAFTLAAGLLFGPVLGVLIAVVASTTSAVIGLYLVRAAGWRLNRLVRHQSVDRVDERLRQRGWVAILSLRLIPAVPFSALNYAAGASAVRVLPYTLATLGGLLPGTAAVVILGDALAGHPSSLLCLVSVCTGTLGLAGLVIEIRHYRQHHRRAPQRTSHGDEPAPEPAIIS
jgi:uncharacterized membrane protein YdjX (TVP38/TMEM64 family)